MQYYVLPVAHYMLSSIYCMSHSSNICFKQRIIYQTQPILFIMISIRSVQCRHHFIYSRHQNIVQVTNENNRKQITKDKMSVIPPQKIDVSLGSYAMLQCAFYREDNFLCIWGTFLLNEIVRNNLRNQSSFTGKLFVLEDLTVQRYAL